MSKGMVIREGREAVFYRCPACKCQESVRIEEIIIEYPGESEAKVSGWVKTTDPKFCKPSMRYVWICPKCARDGVEECC